MRFLASFFWLSQFTKPLQKIVKTSYEKNIPISLASKLFLYKKHRLSCYCNLSTVATNQLAVRKYYMQLELDKQIKFHNGNIKKEISCLHMLVEIELSKVATMKQNIVFLQSKKVECKNTIKFL